MGFLAKLTFPKTDEFAVRIFQLGPGCLMFKIDLSRYFHQIPLDPGDYSLIGYIINGEIYFDKVLPMGMRSAPYIAQRITMLLHLSTAACTILFSIMWMTSWEQSSRIKYGKPTMP